MTTEADSKPPARLVFVDYLRAGAILYIVGFWHLWEYAPNAPGYQTGFTHALTFMALGLFVFLSGFLLGRVEVRASWAGFMSFYGRRLLRIYPLYILALLIFVLFGMTDVTTAVKAAAGLVMFVGPSPATLWFVAMLFWFYLLAPVLIICTRGGPLFVVVCAALYLGLAVLGWMLPHADNRLFIYFPAFAAGIAAGARLWRAEEWRFFAGAAAVLFFALLSSAGNFGLLTVPLDGAVALAGPAFLVACCSRHAKAFAPARVVALVSYASFAMYLFHRPILAACKSAFMPEGFLLQWLYLTAFCLPVIVLTSWAIQMAYDRTLSAMPKG